jgi:hypothetical protein
MEDAQWQGHPLNNHPGQKPIEIQLQSNKALVMACRNCNKINFLLHNVHKEEVMAVMHLIEHSGILLVRLRKTTEQHSHNDHEPCRDSDLYDSIYKPELGWQ